MKQTEIKELSTAELENKLIEFKEAYQQLKMSHAVTPLQNPLEIRAMRKVIARINTELTNRDLQTV